MKIEITKEEARELFDRGYPVRQEAKVGYQLWLSAAGRNWPERFDEEDVRWFKDPSRKTHDEAAGHIFRREEFTIGNVSARIVTLPMLSRGALPREYHASYNGALYAVDSYETPIAWIDRSGEVTMPPVRYSNTTTQHQHMTARALGVGFGATDGSFRKGKGRSPFGPRAGW